jgi:hypothetical protein
LSVVNDAKNVPGSVKGGFLSFGVDSSPENLIDTFSQIGLSLKIQQIVSEAMNATSGTFDPPALAEKLGLKMGSFSAEAKERKTLATSFQTSFNNPFRLSIKGLNYFGASGGISGKELVSFKSPGIALVPGSNSIQMALDLIFSSADAAKQAASQFVTEISLFLENMKEEPSSMFTASSIKFGRDEENAFMFLSRSVIGLRSGLIINENNYKKLIENVGSGTGTSLLDMFKPESLDVEFTNNKRIDSKVLANVNFPFEIKFSIPFVKFGLEVENVPFADISVLGSRISGQGNNVLSLGASLDIKDTPQLATVVEQVVLSVVNDAKNVPGSVKGGFLSFGVDSSPENLIDTFSQIGLSLNIQQIYDSTIRFVWSSNSSAADPLELINQLELSLQNIKVSTAPNRLVQTYLTAGFKSSFPISVKGLGYMTALSGVDTTAILGFSVKGFGLSSGVNNLDLRTDIYFPEGAGDKVASFADNIQNLIMQGGDLVESLFATGVKFGFDEQNAFQFLSKPKFSVPARMIINRAFIDKSFGLLNLVPTDPISTWNNLFVKKLHLTTASQGDLILGLNGGLKGVSFTAQGSVGFIQLSSILDGYS